MLNRIRRMLPHLAILLCNMYIVLYLIDRVNKAMNFIDNGLTKGLLLALCFIGISNARILKRCESRKRFVYFTSQKLHRATGRKHTYRGTRSTMGRIR